MYPRGRSVVRFALIAGLAVLRAAAAPILAPATSLAHCVVDSTTFDDPSSCSLDHPGSAAATLTLFPFVTLTAEAASPPNDAKVHGAAASAIVTYAFAVIGGNPGDIVPIRIATNLSSQGTDSTHGIGFAELAVHSGAAGDSFVAVCSNGTCGSTASSFSGTLNTRVRSGDSGNTLTLQIQASTGDSLIAQSASASADPFIFIDPSFPAAALYSIVVSDGVGNADFATPEPGTLSLYLAATALFGIARRRKRVRCSGLHAPRGVTAGFDAESR